MTTHRYHNWAWLLAFTLGCTVAVTPPPPAPAPAPQPGECCRHCDNGWVIDAAGNRIPCPCPPTCVCKRLEP